MAIALHKNCDSHTDIVRMPNACVPETYAFRRATLSHDVNGTRYLLRVNDETRASIYVLMTL